MGIGVLGFDISPFAVAIYDTIEHYYAGGGRLEDWKVKVSVLWLFWIVAFLAQMMLALFEPGVIEKIIAGEMSGMQITSELLLATTIMMLVPLVMGFLSLTLKDMINRWANVVLGIFYTGLCIYDMVGSLAQLSSYMSLMMIAKIVATALIVWYAWMSKQKV